MSKIVLRRDHYDQTVADKGRKAKVAILTGYTDESQIDTVLQNPVEDLSGVTHVHGKMCSGMLCLKAGKHNRQQIFT
jgi:hypothetical protein